MVRAGTWNSSISSCVISLFKETSEIAPSGKIPLVRKSSASASASASRSFLEIALIAGSYGVSGSIRAPRFFFFFRLFFSRRSWFIMWIAGSFVPDAICAAPPLPLATPPLLPPTITPLLLRSEEHTSELQSLTNLVCRLLLEKKKKKKRQTSTITLLTTHALQ